MAIMVLLTKTVECWIADQYLDDQTHLQQLFSDRASAAKLQVEVVGLEHDQVLGTGISNLFPNPED